MRAGRVLSFLAATVVTFAAAGCAATPPPVSDKVAAYYSSPPTADAGPTIEPIGNALALLKDKARPWTLGVLGDSTGNASDEWVYMAAYQMGSKYDRPVVIHDWSIDTNTYVTETKTRDGANAPIIVWNGSGPSKNTDYSYEFRTVLIPEQPDVVVINHGHNLSSEAAANQGVHRLVEWSMGAWPKTPGVAIVLQNPRADDRAARQEGIVASLQQKWTGSNVALIDAHSAFVNHGNLASLLRPDSLHPNLEGSQLWAQAAAKVLLP